MNSLRTKIIVIVLVFLFLTGTAFIIYSIRVTINYKTLRFSDIRTLMALETEKVNRIIDEIEQGAIFYTTGAELAIEEHSNELCEMLVTRYLDGLPSALGGGFWFEPYVFNNKLRAGYYAFRDREKGEIHLDKSFFLEEYDFHNKLWYREIIDNIKQPNQVVWTRPYNDDSGSYSLMTTAGAALFNDAGKIIAVSTSDWEIDGVVDQLMTIKPTENSFVLLVDINKNYIISGTHNKVNTGDPVTNIPWDLNADSFVYDKINYLSFARLMHNGWLLSVQIPENEMYASINQSTKRFYILIAAAYIAIFLLAYLSVTMLINNPIKQLTSGVAQIALGNLDSEIAVSSKDELGQLAKTFNEMTGELKKSIEENAREREEKKRISTELSVATEIQASMLPSIFPPFPERHEFDIYASMTPAREVGGDFYDFYFIDKDNLVVVIADVSGKGIPAALFMVVAKTLIKNCSACRSPKDVFETVNRKLCENNDACIFVTAFMGFYNIPSKKFSYVNAGHNPPLLKKKDSTFEFLRNEPCMVLAWMKDAKFKTNEITLEEGDVLFMYTDGVTEAMDPALSLFGEERLVNALNANKDSAPKELLCAIKDGLDAFKKEAEQADDITMLALKILGDKEPQKTIEVEAKKENLDTVTEFIMRELDECGYSKILQNEIVISAEEIFINIASYAYQGKPGTVKISVSTKEKTAVTFEDTGFPYNPLEQASPDLDKPIADREIGGLGIYLVRKMMDSIEYSRENGKNVLKIIKEHPELE